MTKKICFVIQPFYEPYENRFDIFYKPAIERAGLTALRADGPEVVEIPDYVKKCIRKAHICFVDITEDNLNVWYELGFADGLNKPIVVVSNADSRDENGLPSDIRGRFVIFYESRVDTDASYRKDIVQKIIKQSEERVKEADSGSNISPVTTQQFQNSDYVLTPFCSRILKMIFIHCFEDEYIMGIRDIIFRFPDIEEEQVKIALHKLETDGFITRGKLPNYVTGEGSGYHLTDEGNQWISNNPD